MLDKMKRIDIFFCKKFDEYCYDCLIYNEVETQKSFSEYIKANKSLLVRLYVEERRRERKARLN